MNVCDQWNADFFLDLAEFFRRFAHRHGAAHDVAARRL
jgi:hypothetical protein